MTPEQKDHIVTLFSDKHWSCNMIAKETRFSRAGIKKFLNHAGYDTSKAIGRHVTYQCQNCNKSITTTSARFRATKNHYCSTKCYYEFIKDGEYKPWRHGQRIARAIIQPVMSRIFQPNQPFVIHHKDGNDENNIPSNLIAFPTQSDHLAYHRNHRIVSILIDAKNFNL